MTAVDIAARFGATLIDVARESIRHGLEHQAPRQIPLRDFPGDLHEPLASFVTLNHAAQLRGCIGTLEATRPLVIDVAENAYAAAFSDPRFAPLTTREWHGLEIHISVLSTPETMTFASEQELLRQLRPDVDGVILEERGQRGTFLPSVWKQLPRPDDFLRQLKHKMGLPAEYWSGTVRVRRYTCVSIS